MVFQKMFSFNKGSSSSNTAVGNNGVRFNSNSTSIEYPNGGYNYPNDYYDDDEGTIGSQNTKSILRRWNEKRNTNRNVSWSNTFDTYEEGDAPPPSPGAGAGGHGQYLGQDMDMDDLIDMVDTFDTIDTYEQGGRMAAAAAAAANGGVMPETRQDTNAYLPDYYGVQQQQPPQQSYESDTLINNGRDRVVESLSISEDGEVEVHMMKPPPPPGMIEAPRQVERKQLEQTAPQQPMVEMREQAPPPPMNNTMMEAPRQQDRKNLGQTLSFPPQQQYQPPSRPAAMFQPQMGHPEQVSEYRNLACISNVSDSTLELMRDRYGGLGGGDDDIQEHQEAEEVREKANSPGSAERDTQNSSSKEEGVKKVVKTSSSFLSNPFKKKSKPATEAEAEAQEPAVQVSKEKQEPFKQEESAVKPSPVFIPRELELPEQVHLAFSDSGSLGSLSMDELDDTTLFDNLDVRDIRLDTTLFDNLDDSNNTRSNDEDTVTRNKKRAGHNHGHSDYIVRAASDDESIASLTRKHSDYDVMFKKQQEADKSGGHIGLILPFLNTGKVEFKAPTWGDMETLKNDLLRGVAALSPVGTSMSSSAFMGESSSSKDGESKLSSAFLSSGTSASNDGESKLSSGFFTNGTVSRPSDGESKLSSAFFSKSTSKESADDTKNGESRSMDSSDGKAKSLSMTSASEDQMKSVSYSASVATEDGSSPDKDGVESYAPAGNVVKKNDSKEGLKKINSSSKAKDGSSDDRSVLSTKSLMDNESTEEDCEEVEDVPSDDSTEVNSAQLSNDDDESDDSFVINDPGQVIELQDLVENKSSKTRKLLKKKLSKKNKKNKAAQQQQSQPPRQIITDPSTMWNEDMFLEHQNNDITNKASKSRLGKIRWSLKRGNKNRGPNNNLNSDAPFSPTSTQSNRFVPKLLPTGRVYEADDNASVISQASSCVTTASILSELKLIEDTAKVMYQQMKALSEQAAGGCSGAGPSGMASHNNVSSLWGGAQQQETELVRGEGEKRRKKNDKVDDGPMAITCGDLQCEAGELYDVDELVDAEQQQLQQQEQVAAKKRGGRLSKMFVKLKSKKTGRGVAATLTPNE